MRTEVKQFVDTYANKYITESFGGGRAVDINKFNDDIHIAIPTIAIEEVREAIPYILTVAK